MLPTHACSRSTGSGMQREILGSPNNLTLFWNTRKVLVQKNICGLNHRIQPIRVRLHNATRITGLTTSVPTKPKQDRNLPSNLVQETRFAVSPQIWYGSHQDSQLFTSNFHVFVDMWGGSGGEEFWYGSVLLFFFFRLLNDGLKKKHTHTQKKE